MRAEIHRYVRNGHAACGPLMSTETSTCEGDNVTCERCRALMPCADCHGEGRVRRRDGLWVDCDTCGGSGDAYDDPFHPAHGPFRAEARVAYMIMRDTDKPVRSRCTGCGERYTEGCSTCAQHEAQEWEADHRE